MDNKSNYETSSMRKTMVSIREQQNQLLKQKRLTIKKIIQMSTMDQNTQKRLLKIIKNEYAFFNRNIQDNEITKFTIQQNANYLKGKSRNQDAQPEQITDKTPEETLKKLLEYCEKILDTDKIIEVEKALHELFTKATEIPDERQAYFDYDLFLSIIPYFVLSPVEKQFIKKIQEELAESENLDSQIAGIQEEIDKEKNTKLQKYREYKQFPQALSDSKNFSEINQKPQSEQDKRDKKKKFMQEQEYTCDQLLHQISTYENKLEKSNQKLNEILSQNNNLRDKINQLRKEKNVIEQVYNNLKDELEEKKQNVEATIKSAANAYFNRNKAEEELKELQEKAEIQKIEFEKEYKELNKNIQYDKRFKEFIKSKQTDKVTLNKLEEQIKNNQEIINKKKQQNEAIDREYQLSAQKEEEIKQAFELIKKETGINSKKEQETEELLKVFIHLYQNNQLMKKFVDELKVEVEVLENQITEKKKQIQIFSTKGVTSDNQRREQKIQLMNKIQQEEKKKEILKTQYEKSLETINEIKKYLVDVFKQINIEDKIVQNLENSAITEENMIYYLGILEQKGIDSISEYARLIAEQLKLEKGEMPGIQQQTDDLNNIIAYENANIMNYYQEKNNEKKNENKQCPFIFEFPPSDPTDTNFYSHEEMRQFAEDLIKQTGSQDRRKMPGQTEIGKSAISQKKEKKSKK